MILVVQNVIIFKNSCIFSLYHQWNFMLLRQIFTHPWWSWQKWTLFSIWNEEFESQMDSGLVLKTQCSSRSFMRPPKKFIKDVVINHYREHLSHFSKPLNEELLFYCTYNKRYKSYSGSVISNPDTLPSKRTHVEKGKETWVHWVHKTPTVIYGVMDRVTGVSWEDSEPPEQQQDTEGQHCLWDSHQHTQEEAGRSDGQKEDIKPLLQG